MSHTHAISQVTNLSGSFFLEEVDSASAEVNANTRVALGVNPKGRTGYTNMGIVQIALNYPGSALISDFCHTSRWIIGVRNITNASKTLMAVATFLWVRSDLVSQ